MADYGTMEEQSLDMRYAMDDKLFVVFYVRPVQNGVKSEEAGRPIFEDTPCIKIHVPGDKTTIIDVPVTDEHKRRFSSRWEKFEKNMVQNAEGTPLEEWPQLKTSQVQEFRAVGITTVEQIAALADSKAQQFMGGFDLKRKAETYLKLSQDTAEAQRLAVENAELQGRLKNQDDAIRNLSAQVEILLQQKVESDAPSAQTRRVKADGRTGTGSASL